MMKEIKCFLYFQTFEMIKIVILDRLQMNWRKMQTVFMQNKSAAVTCPEIDDGSPLVRSHKSLKGEVFEFHLNIWLLFNPR